MHSIYNTMLLLLPYAHKVVKYVLTRTDHLCSSAVRCINMDACFMAAYDFRENNEVAEFPHLVHERDHLRV